MVIKLVPIVLSLLLSVLTSPLYAQQDLDQIEQEEQIADQAELPAPQEQDEQKISEVVQEEVSEQAKNAPEVEQAPSAQGSESKAVPLEVQESMAPQNTQEEIKELVEQSQEEKIALPVNVSTSQEIQRPQAESVPLGEAVNIPDSQEPVMSVDTTQTQQGQEVQPIVPVKTEEPGKPVEAPVIQETQKPVVVTPVPVQSVQETIQEVPAVIPDVADKIAKESEKEIVGIDTVDLEEPQGNWLFKRIWWERAETKYEKIRALVDKIFETRMIFFTKRNDLDKNVLDPFYLAVGLGQGEFQEVLAELIDKIEQEQDQEGVLASGEREFKDLLKNEGNTLKQAELDIAAINKLDNEIDEGLTTLLEQINRVRSYEQEAWNYFKEIARVLDDKQARALYYKMDITASNINDINNYIVQTFTPFFDELISTANQQVVRIKSAVEELSEKGIDLKKQSEGFYEPEVVPVLPEQPQDIEFEVQELEEPGWFTTYVAPPFYWLASGVETVWNAFVYVVRLPIDMLFGTSEQESEIDNQDFQESESVQEQKDEEIQQVNKPLKN